jgi:hypothetical protein
MKRKTAWGYAICCLIIASIFLWSQAPLLLPEKQPGPRCPQCGSSNVTWINEQDVGKPTWACKDCHNIWTPRE